MAKITVLGAGAWGTAFGQVLADAGNDVTMWGKETSIMDDINHNHRNSARLPIVEKLPDRMVAEGDRAQAVRNAEIVVVSIAAQAARSALAEFVDLISQEALVVSLMKGIERTTEKRMDQVVTEVLNLPEERFVAVSGPNLSQEVAQRHPSGTVVGSVNLAAAHTVAHACATDYFKPYVSDDVIGLEMCGSLKNVVALAVGMSRGAGKGENTAAMIETRGLSELTALGIAAGAKAETFQGLAGFGDLVATCGSPLSRNYTFGFNLGQGMSVDEATAASNGVAEGVPTTSAAVALAADLGVEMPLATAMSHVISDDIGFDEMMAELFGTEITGE